jgi:uncharacterized protein YjiS (DUF1127 family)
MRRQVSSLHRTFWPDRLRYALNDLAGWIWAWAERSSQRRALMELDDDRLWDIGRSRSEAQAEAGKPFWRR